MTAGQVSLYSFGAKAETKIHWEIPNFKKIKTTPASYVTSPTFVVFESECVLHLFPYGCPGDTEGWSCVRVLNVGKTEISTTWTLGVVNVVGNVQRAASFDCSIMPQTAQMCENIWKYSDIIKTSEGMLIDDTLKIQVIATRSWTAHDELKSSLGALFTSGEFSDVKFRVGDTEIPAHRSILAARSPYFKAMFTHKMKEAHEGVVIIKDIEPHVFKELLGYLYTGYVGFAKDDEKTRKLPKAVDLLIAADRFQVSDLKANCANLLIVEINVDNAAELLQLAAQFQLPLLKNQVIQYICADGKRRMDIMETEAFQKLYPDLLNDIIMTLTPVSAESKKRRREERKTLTKEDVKKLKLSELRVELEHRNMTSVGPRQELEEQLQANIEKSETNSS